MINNDLEVAHPQSGSCRCATFKSLFIINFTQKEKFAEPYHLARNFDNFDLDNWWTITQMLWVTTAVILFCVLVTFSNDYLIIVWVQGYVKGFD